MELLKDTNIDFMKYRKFWIIVVGGPHDHGCDRVVRAFFGFEPLNFGIDFVGGTQLTLRFREAPKVEDLRSLLEGAGLGEPVIQTVGERGSRDVIIKTRRSRGAKRGTARASSPPSTSEYNQSRDRAGRQSGRPGRPDPDPRPGRSGSRRGDGRGSGAAHYQGIAAALLKQRQQEGIFRAGTGSRRSGSDPGRGRRAGAELLSRRLSLLGNENVGPQIGKELRTQGFLAVVASLLGMLAYIWFRFELRFGIGAVMASLHDVS